MHGCCAIVQAAVGGWCNNFWTSHEPRRHACDVLEAFAGVMFLATYIRDDFFTTYVPTALRFRSCFASDDYVFSNYLWLRRVPRRCAYGKNHRAAVKPMEVGLGSDALHVMSSMHARYRGCYEALNGTAPQLARLPIRANCSQYHPRECFRRLLLQVM